MSFDLAKFCLSIYSSNKDQIRAHIFALCILFHWLFPKCCSMGVAIIPHIQMRKVRLEEAEYLATTGSQALCHSPLYQSSFHVLDLSLICRMWPQHRKNDRTRWTGGFSILGNTDLFFFIYKIRITTITTAMTHRL